METIPNPTSFQAIEALIHLIEDKDRIKGILAEISTKRDEANERIKLAGDIKDIGKAKEEADATLATANTVLEEAQQRAKEIVRKAGVEADEVEIALKDRNERERKANVKQGQELLARETAVGDRERDARSKLETADKLHRAAVILKKAAEQKSEQANATLEYFRNAISQVPN